MMEPNATDLIMLIICGAAVLAAVVFLRVLAIHREQEIERHNLIREVKRVRAEYERKIRQDADEDEIIV